MTNNSLQKKYMKCVKLLQNVKLSKCTVLKACGCTAPLIYNLGTKRGEWLAWCFGRCIPRRKVSGTHWTGGWVGPRDGLDGLKKRKALSCQVGTDVCHLLWRTCSSGLSRSLCGGCWQDRRTAELVRLWRGRPEWMASSCRTVCCLGSRVLKRSIER